MACRIVGADVLQRATLAGDNDHGEDHGDKLAETHLCIGDLRISVRQSVGSSYCPRPLKTAPRGRLRPLSKRRVNGAPGNRIGGAARNPTCMRACIMLRGCLAVCGLPCVNVEKCRPAIKSLSVTIGCNRLQSIARKRCVVGQWYHGKDTRQLFQSHRPLRRPISVCLPVCLFESFSFSAPFSCTHPFLSVLKFAVSLLLILSLSVLKFVFSLLLILFLYQCSSLHSLAKCLLSLSLLNCAGVFIFISFHWVF